MEVTKKQDWAYWWNEYENTSQDLLDELEVWSEDMSLEEQFERGLISEEDYDREFILRKINEES